MKSLSVFLCCALIALFSVSCSDGTSEVSKAAETVKTKMAETTTSTTPPPNAVSYGEAKGWTDAWQKSFLPEVGVQGWTLPADDLKDILDENVDSARFYIGQIESTGEFKLVVIGVNSLGQDMLDSTATPAQLIYDLSRPCPPTCGSFVDGE